MSKQKPERPLRNFDIKMRFISMGLIHSIILCSLVLSCYDSRELEHKVKVATTPYSDQAFVMAIADGDQALLNRFLSGDFNPNAKNRFGDSALHWATYRQKADLMDLLLKRGADPNQLGSYDMTPLMWACKQGFHQIAQTLIRSGAEVNGEDKWGNTPLHHASKAGDMDLVALLLAKGATINALNEDNESPIFDAIRRGHPDVAKLLLAQGANPKVISASGEPLLHLAIDMEMTHVFRDPNTLKKHPWINDELDDLMADVVENFQEKPDIDWHRLTQKIHALMNDQRIQADLPPLDLDTDLSTIAQAHSKNMAALSFFEHVNPDGETPSDRAHRFGFESRRTLPDGMIREGIAENIFQGRLYSGSAYHFEKGIRIVSHNWLSEDDLAKRIVSGLMDSPGHRKNILGIYHTHEGIGLALDSEDRLYFTQNLW